MKHFFRRLVAIFMVLALAAPVVYAQEEEEVPQGTQTHILGFLFHKLAGTEPDYSKWVAVYLENKLSSYGEEGKKAQLRQARSRFVNIFNNLSVEKNRKIVIPFYADMEVVPFETRYLMNIELAGGSNFIIKDTPEFAINLVVPDLEEKLKHVISRKEFEEFKKLAIDNYEKKKPINLFLTLKAVDADGEKPLVVNGKKYWLMLTEFDTYEIWDSRMHKKIWQYVSEEEKRKNLEELRKLYKPEEKKEGTKEVYEDFTY